MIDDHDAVFARAVDAGEVWISGLGAGAGSADVTVTSADWTGTPEIARTLFYRGLEAGQLSITHAQVVHVGRVAPERHTDS